MEISMKSGPIAFGVSFFPVKKERKSRMPRVQLTITKSACRCGYHSEGETFMVEDLCPPLCHELWHRAYPFVYVLLNGGTLDYGGGRATAFDVECPDGGRVHLHGETL